MEVSGQLHAPAAFCWGKSPWPQTQFGRAGKEKKSPPLPEI